MDRVALWATVHRVTKSRTRLMQFSRQAGRHLIGGQFLLRLERMRSSNLVNQDFFKKLSSFLYSKVSFTKPNGLPTIQL